MYIRERNEETEKEVLSRYATLSKNTSGRKKYEEKCNIRTDFQRDRDRIIHSKAFRRLKHKTQVFIAPEGDHYRTRLTHTLEVAQISRTLAKALRLNEDLTEAIALGHDLGHTPFGHTGERVLNELHLGGFEHNKQSLRVVDFLEFRKEDRGLNLTLEVRDGILKHTGEDKPMTLEGKLVRFADRIAYINHDIDDAIRADILHIDKLPKDCIEALGYSHGERINTMISDIIENSLDMSNIQMSKGIKYYTDKLRQFMFENLYFNREAKKEDDKAQYILEELYSYYMKKFDSIPNEYREKDQNKEDVVCDYIAGMTDRYAINLFKEIFVPRPWRLY
ncbi:deoxyguanosinetriphosphate triphosphohydrolase [Clostridiisalibacter paucivorans]|uniref:deoxyguanosinetriphosphate triphosphohydrolase n=1 Tax=Clostridiisalibacter paucivorans TaxID=408753 RepID=UPI00047B1F3E|nr:deoxyguanosinetriphosphate triphosphohydrolase [Clostridiisalibacter paucivorans]